MEVSYERDILLIVRTLLQAESQSEPEENKLVGLIAREIVSPGRSTTCSSGSSEEDAIVDALPRLPVAALSSGIQRIPFEPLMLTEAPPGLTQQTPSEKDYDSPCSSGGESTATTATSAPKHWSQLQDGTNKDYSFLLTRLQREPNTTIALSALRREAPKELRRVMKDPKAFATWLRHRTGLIEVSGPAGKELVFLKQSVHEQKNPVVAETTAVDEVCTACFSLNPAAAEFVPPSSEVMQSLNADTSSFLLDEANEDDDGLINAAIAAGTDRMTVAEVHEKLYAQRPPDADVEAYKGYSAYDAFICNAFGGFNGFFAIDLNSNAPTKKDLNPKAAEFQPMTPIKARSKKSRKAALVEELVPNRIRPEAIPEESVTESEDSFFWEEADQQNVYAFTPSPAAAAKAAAAAAAA